MAHYYDLVLGLIPLVLGGITAALTVVGVSLTAAVPLAALVAVGLIGHGMFVRTPGASATSEPAPQPDTQSFDIAD
jgi:ABC-type arginine/histidine transport system permease subunit